MERAKLERYSHGDMDIDCREAGVNPEDFPHLEHADLYDLNVLVDTNKEE